MQNKIQCLEDEARKIQVAKEGHMLIMRVANHWNSPCREVIDSFNWRGSEL